MSATLSPDLSPSSRDLVVLDPTAVVDDEGKITFTFPLDQDASLYWCKVFAGQAYLVTHDDPQYPELMGAEFIAEPTKIAVENANNLRLLPVLQVCVDHIVALTNEIVGKREDELESEVDAVQAALDELRHANNRRDHIRY